MGVMAIRSVEGRGSFKPLPSFTPNNLQGAGESQEAGIYLDKTQYSSAEFLHRVLDECPYTGEFSYSDNGTEYKGTDRHAYVTRCRKAGIGQKFTRCKRPQTNGKAERVIPALMDMCHKKRKIQVPQAKARQPLAFHQFFMCSHLKAPCRGRCKLLAQRSIWIPQGRRENPCPFSPSETKQL